MCAPGLNPGKLALITGHSSGIGRDICLRLLGEGYRTIGLARRQATPTIDHPDHEDIQIDLSDLESVAGWAKGFVQRSIPVDTLICCAGHGRFGDLETFSLAQIKRIMDVNFTAHAYLIRSLLPGMKRIRYGNIIAIGSESAIDGGRKGPIYSASKAALRGLIQSVRKEAGSKGVRVSIINPGMVRTPFFNDLNFAPGPDEAHALETGDITDAVMMVLMGRAGAVIDEINLSPRTKVIDHKGQKNDK